MTTKKCITKNCENYTMGENGGYKYSTLYCEKCVVKNLSEEERRKTKRKEWIEESIKEMDEGEDGQFDFENNIICPWCGDEWYADFEDDYYADEGEHETQCYSCDKAFIIDTNVSITYSMRRE